MEMNSSNILNGTTDMKKTHLPDKIETQMVVEMIQNADIYELISLSKKELGATSTSLVEDFIKDMLIKNIGQK